MTENMLGQLSLVGQSIIFVGGVYLEKFARRHFLSKQQSISLKITTRIITCFLVTLAILTNNYNQICVKDSISFINCFYLRVNLTQIGHVLLANTLLFSTHIWQQFVQIRADYSRYTIKSVFFAPLLQEFLFRASFYRSGRGTVSTAWMASLFSLSHLHRPIYKSIVGQQADWKGAIRQMLFTLIFGCYSFYFLASFESVIPSIVLHCYCNFLGPPRLNSTNLKWHLLSVVSVIVYCYIFI